VGFLSDPALQGIRDPVARAAFDALLMNLPGGLGAQFGALAGALLAKVPGADPVRCVERPPFPDINAPRDPPIAADEQVRITDIVLTAFFDGFLRDSLAGRRFVGRLPRRDRLAREVRLCNSATHPRPCHLPPLPSSPSGAFLP
jgi:hypothetical protein